VTVLHDLVSRTGTARRSRLLSRGADDVLTTFLDVRSPNRDFAEVRREDLVVVRPVIADKRSDDRRRIRIGFEQKLTLRPTGLCAADGTAKSRADPIVKVTALTDFDCIASPPGSHGTCAPCDE
jgi:hypothetical protein